MLKRDVFYDEADMELWDVIYIDKYGNKQCVRYCARTEEEAKRLFRSEQERGETLIAIKKAKVEKA